MQLLHYSTPLLRWGSPSICFFFFSNFIFYWVPPFKKVWHRQSKVNRLFNLFSPCQETLSCEITEQKPRQRSCVGNGHREHPSALAPTSVLRSELQNTNTETSSSTLLKNRFTVWRKGVWKLDIHQMCTAYNHKCIASWRSQQKLRHHC